MSLEFDFKKRKGSIIKVIGVGGGGGNAVASMYKAGIQGVDFAVCNTDNQALDSNPVEFKIQLGPHLTDGRGAGSKPEVGKQACLESMEDIKEVLNDGTKMLFITAGMGGGTGTGAAPILAKAAKELGILTVAIITLPFKFEGMRRQRYAIEGLEELKQNVDAYLVISNDRLSEMYGNLGLSEAFGMADNILTTAAKGIAEIITVTGYINVDFEDVNTVMRGSGISIMGSATAEGEDRARRAIHEAMNSPLLEENDIRGAQHILLNLTSGTKEITMAEVAEITNYVQEEAGYGTNIIWGNCRDEALGAKLSVTLIATGFRTQQTNDAAKLVDHVRIPLEAKKGIIDEPFGLSKEERRKATVVDFEEDDVNYTIREFNKSNTHDDISSEPKVQENRLEEDSKWKVEEARRNFIRKSLNTSLDTPESIYGMENEPAYKRRNVNLEDEQDIKENRAYSRTEVRADKKNPFGRSNNTFLHENVD